MANAHKATDHQVKRRSVGEAATDYWCRNVPASIGLAIIKRAFIAGARWQQRRAKRST